MRNERISLRSLSHYSPSLRGRRPDVLVLVERDLRGWQRLLLGARMKHTTKEVLQRIEELLVKAGAKLPIDNQGTIESAMKTGLSIALVIVQEEIRSLNTTEEA